MDLLFALGVLAGTVVFVVYVCAGILRQKRRSRIRDLAISPLSGLALGAAFLGLQAILNPETRYVVAEQLKEQTEEYESGAEPPGGRQFHEQLRDIRAGSDVEMLIVQVAYASRASNSTAAMFPRAAAGAMSGCPASCGGTTASRPREDRH